MDIISGLLSQSSSVEKPINVQQTIVTVCDKLIHGVLISDRRAAVLGLKAFSRQYRETVAEHGLRGLVSTLQKDIEDIDIVKAILETLLILFIRGEGDEDLTRNWISQQSRFQNGKYPSPILMNGDSTEHDQFSMFIADELTKSQETIQCLISILENENNFHIRLYTIQLLEALISIRPERTKEVIQELPLGVSTIVSILKDDNEPVRNESILLLMGLVNNNFNIQKLVAFENTFDTLFDIIEEEGGIRGSIFVQDSLSLITNLLKYNASNQKFFLETNCVPRLASLLDEPISGTDGPIIWNEQRLQNMITCLDICRLFASQDNDSVKSNQDKLFKCGVLLIVLKLVFSPQTPNSIRVNALLTTGDLINSNPAIQYQFSEIDVPYIDPSLPIQLQRFEGLISVTNALLNWCLYSNSVHTFDIRVAASTCLHAYLRDNSDSKQEFLQEQIAGFNQPEDELVDEPTQEPKQDIKDPEMEPKLNGNSNGESATPSENGSNGTIVEKQKQIPIPKGNIFSVLMDYDDKAKLNPYKTWFAGLVLIYTFEDNEENKKLAQSVKVGNAEAGEEVMSAIQAMSEILITSLQYSDPRMSVCYLMLLSIWLYEDFDAVNDFLTETSTIKSILTYAYSLSNGNPMVQGMASILLGIAYEFSSKDSPTSRKDLFSLISSGLGKDTYGLKLRQFKDSDLFKSFDEDHIFEAKRDESGLPEVFFHSTFVDLVRDNFSRIKRALARDPEVEPLGRLSYDLFDELETKSISLKNSLEDAKLTAVKTELDLNERIENLTKEYESVLESYENTKDELDSLDDEHSDLVEKYEDVTKELTILRQSKKGLEDSSSKYYQQLQDLVKQNDLNSTNAKQLSEKLTTTEQQKSKAEEGINKMSRELFSLTREKNESEKTIKALKKELESGSKVIEKSKKDYEKLKDDNNKLKSKLEALNLELKNLNDLKVGLESQVSDLSRNLDEGHASNEQLMDKLRAAAGAFQDIKNEKLESLSQLSKMEAEVKSLTEKASGLELQLNLAAQEKADIANALEKVKASSSDEIRALNDALITANHEKATIHATNVQLNEKVSSLSIELEKAVADLEETKKVANVKSEQYEIEIQKLKSTMDKLKLQQEIQKTSLSKELENLKVAHDGIGEENAQKAKEIEKHVSRVEILTTELSALEAKHSTITKNLYELKESHDTQKASLAERENDLTILKLAKAELETTVKELETQQNVSFEKLQISLKQLDEERSNSLAIKKEMDEALIEKEKLMNEKIESREKEITKELGNSAKINADLQEKMSTLEKEQSDLHKNSKDLESKINSNEMVIKEKELLLANTTEKLELRIKDLLADNSKYESEISQKVEEVQKAGEQLSSLEVIKSELSASLKAKEDTIKKMEEEKVKSEQVKSSVESELAISSKEVKSLTKELETLKNDLKKSEKNLQSLKSKYESETSTLNSKISGLEGDITKLRSDLNDKGKEIEKERAMLTDNSTSAIKEYSEKITTLEEKLSDNENTYVEKLKSIKSEKDLIQKKAEEANENIENLTFEIQEYQQKETKLISENETLTEEVHKSKTLVGILERDLQLNRSKLESLEAESSSKNEKTGKEIDLLEKEVLGMKAKLIEETKKAELGQSELEEATVKHNATIGELSDTKSQLEVINGQVEEFKSKLTSIEREKLDLQKSFESEKSSLLKQFDALASEMTLSKEEFSETKKDLEKKVEELSKLVENSKLDSESESKTLLTRVKELEAETARANELTASLKVTEAAKLEHQEKHLKASEALESSNSQIKELTESINKAKSSIVELEGTLARETSELASVKSKLRESEESSDVLSKELSKAKASEIAITKEGDDKERSLKMKSEELENLRSEKVDIEAELKSSAEIAKKENEELKSEVTSLKTKLDEEINKFTAQIKSLTDQKSSSSNSDLDDLMLLMNEMDDKNKKYKARLQKLGEEVSSDEESDEEDDESEEED